MVQLKLLITSLYRIIRDYDSFIICLPCFPKILSLRKSDFFFSLTGLLSYYQLLLISRQSARNKSIQKQVLSVLRLLCFVSDAHLAGFVRALACPPLLSDELPCCKCAANEMSYFCFRSCRLWARPPSRYVTVVALDTASALSGALI